MTELAIAIAWERQEDELKPGKYSNAHLIAFDQMHRIRGDAAPDWGGDPAHTNPEQALAAALSSCHMMTFLALAAKAKWPVARYSDKAVAGLGKNSGGSMAITSIALHPKVEFDDGFDMGPDMLSSMHEKAHRYCFVANSLGNEVKMTVK